MRRFIVWDGPGFYVPSVQGDEVFYKRWGKNFFQEFFSFAPENAEYFESPSEIDAEVVDNDN